MKLKLNEECEKMRVLYYSLLLAPFAACVAGEGDRFLCVNTCVGVRYVLSVGGAFADRVCRSNDRGEFIKSEILSNRANLVDDTIPFDFNVTVTRHAVSGCGSRRSWDKTAPDSGIQIALILSTELPVGDIQIAASGATEYAEFFTSENFRRLLDDEDVEVVATYIATTTTNATSAVYDVIGLVTGYTSTSAPFISTTAVGTTLAETLDATTSTLPPTLAATLTTSTLPLTTSTLALTTSTLAASQPNNKTSDNRIINDKFIGDDLSKEFLGQKSDSTVLAINLLLTLCAVMVATTI